LRLLLLLSLAAQRFHKNGREEQRCGSTQRKAMAHTDTSMDRHNKNRSNFSVLGAQFVFSFGSGFLDSTFKVQVSRFECGFGFDRNRERERRTLNRT
jgi:hypothetical protein